MKKVSKRILMLVLVIVLVLSFTACGGGDDDDGVYNLRLSTLGNVGTPLYESNRWFVNRVAELTGGNVQIQLFPASQLGDYISVAGEVILGSVDMSWESVAVMYDDRLPLVSVPFLVSNWDEVAYTFDPVDGWYANFLAEVFADLGVLKLGGSPGNFLGVGGNNVGNIDDLFNPDIRKDALLRIPPSPIPALVFEVINYNITVIPFADLYSALQTGLAEAWWGGDPSLNYHGFRDVIQYYVAFDTVMEYYPILINYENFRSLPVAYQEAIRQAALEASAVGKELHKNSVDYYFQRLRDYGITVIIPTPEELAALADRVRAEVWPQLGDIVDPAIVEDLLNHVEERNRHLRR